MYVCFVFLILGPGSNSGEKMIRNRRSSKSIECREVGLPPHSKLDNGIRWK